MRPLLPVLPRAFVVGKHGDLPCFHDGAVNIEMRCAVVPHAFVACGTRNRFGGDVSAYDVEFEFLPHEFRLHGCEGFLECAYTP